MTLFWLAVVGCLVAVAGLLFIEWRTRRWDRDEHVSDGWLDDHSDSGRRGKP